MSPDAPGPTSFSVQYDLQSAKEREAYWKRLRYMIRNARHAQLFPSWASDHSLNVGLMPIVQPALSTTGSLLASYFQYPEGPNSPGDLDSGYRIAMIAHPATTLRYMSETHGFARGKFDTGYPDGFIFDSFVWRMRQGDARGPFTDLYNVSISGRVRDEAAAEVSLHRYIPCSSCDIHRTSVEVDALLDVGPMGRRVDWEKISLRFADPESGSVYPEVCATAALGLAANIIADDRNFPLAESSLRAVKRTFAHLR